MGDFDGDGVPDLVTANASASNVSVLLGNGDGIFEEHQLFQTERCPQSVAGDFEGDGFLDIVTANWGGSATFSTVSLLRGKGAGTFHDPVRPFGVFATPLAVAVADMDGDGNLDIVVASRDGRVVHVTLGNGEGAFPIVPCLVTFLQHIVCTLVTHQQFD